MCNWRNFHKHEQTYLKQHPDKEAKHVSFPVVPSHPASSRDTHTPDF